MPSSPALPALLDQLPISEFRNLLRAGLEHENRGENRAAAATYRTALQRIPPSLSPAARPLLEHAHEAVLANDRELEAFLESRLAPVRARHPSEPVERFEKCREILLRKRRVYRPSPSFMYFPQLPAVEFYDRSLFPSLPALEAATDDIREELLGVLAEPQPKLEPYVAVDGAPLPQWRQLNKSDRWSVFYLWRAGEPCPENLARCPRTAAALEPWIDCRLRGTGPSAVFSILKPQTRIPPHVGVNNARLIVHLPLIVPEGCGFRVGAESRSWRPGEAFVFDDTIEHEAWNDSDQPRAVLILDTWNPHLSQAERELVSELTEGVGDFYGDLPAYASGAPA